MGWVRGMAGVAVLGLAACAAPPPADTGPAPAPDFERVDAAPAEAAPADAGGYAPVVAEPAPVVVAEPGGTGPGGTGRVRAGVLTAGDIDDTLNQAAFERFLLDARASTGLPVVDLSGAVLARLTGPDGAPAPHLRVTLRRPGAAEPFWDGYSGTDGWVSVFPAALGAGRMGAVELRAFPEDGGEPVAQRIATDAPAEVALPFGAGTPAFLDLVLVLDVTGSMGDELEWLKADLDGVLAAATRGMPGIDVRTGLVLYRDTGDAYTLRGWDLDRGTGLVRRRLGAESAAGGGDWPEAVADAMEAALGLSWRRGQGERILLQVGDAPPHAGDARRYLNAAGEAARRQIQILTLGASGVDPEAEMLMRQAAALTQGRYLFLTDDSGVGLSHEEPTVRCYVVTELRDLLTRVLRSELAGRRIEAAPGAVVREVGTTQGGVCRD